MSFKKDICLNSRRERSTFVGLSLRSGRILFDVSGQSFSSLLYTYQIFRNFLDINNNVYINIDKKYEYLKNVMGRNVLFGNNNTSYKHIIHINDDIFSKEKIVDTYRLFFKNKIDIYNLNVKSNYLSTLCGINIISNIYDDAKYVFIGTNLGKELNKYGLKYEIMNDDLDKKCVNNNLNDYRIDTISDTGNVIVNKLNYDNFGHIHNLFNKIKKYKFFIGKSSSLFLLNCMILNEKRCILFNNGNIWFKDIFNISLEISENYKDNLDTIIESVKNFEFDKFYEII